MKTFVGLMLTLLMTVSVSAATPQGSYCFTHSSGGICRYEGLVSEVYVNNTNLILVFFEDAFGPTEASDVGISGVNKFNAVAVHISPDPEFARMFYSTVLAAQAQGRVITVQMNTTHGGYLEADRIWME